jgi:hypothetical protein
MSKSATEVIQDAVFSAVIDTIEAMKSNAAGMPNTLLRDIASLHSNSTFGDLPPHLQAAVKAAVSSTLNRLRKENYLVTPNPRTLARDTRR